MSQGELVKIFALLDSLEQAIGFALRSHHDDLVDAQSVRSGRRGILGFSAQLSEASCRLTRQRIARPKSLFQHGERPLVNPNGLVSPALSATKLTEIPERGRCLGVVLAPDFSSDGHGLFVKGLRFFKSILTETDRSEERRVGK